MLQSSIMQPKPVELANVIVDCEAAMMTFLRMLNACYAAHPVTKRTCARFSTSVTHAPNKHGLFASQFDRDLRTEASMIFMSLPNEGKLAWGVGSPFWSLEGRGR